jgi:hypothetical protein
MHNYSITGEIASPDCLRGRQSVPRVRTELSHVYALRLLVPPWSPWHGTSGAVTVGRWLGRGKRSGKKSVAARQVGCQDPALGHPRTAVMVALPQSENSCLPCAPKDHRITASHASLISPYNLLIVKIRNGNVNPAMIKQAK